MKKLLFFLIIPIISFGQAQVGNDIIGEGLDDRFGQSVSLSSDGTILAIGAPLNDNSGTDSGQVRVYENQGDDWTQIGEVINGEAQGDFAGTTVSISSDGRIVAIGALGNDGNGVNAGQVRIFENQEDSWIQIGEAINGEAPGDFLGTSVSLSSDGSIVAVGADRNSVNGTNAGQVRVYENQEGNWTQIGEAINGEAQGDFLGSGVSLSLDGSIVAIGAIANDSNGNSTGKVRIYQNQEGSWVQIGEDINGETPGDFLGSGLSLSSDGSIVAIGATGNNVNAGIVRIFENQGDNWIQIGEDINGETPGDFLGTSVSLSSDGSFIAIGASFNDGSANSTGVVGIYENQEGNWVQIGQDIEGEEGSDFLGTSVSLSSDGSFVAIGAIQQDIIDPKSGYVQIFDTTQILSTQESLLSTFSIYPNPAKETITITLQDVNTLQKTTIYNSLGQEVLESTQSSLDVSSLSKGVYVIEVQTPTGKASKKLIVE